MLIRPMIVSMLLSLIWPAITYAIPIDLNVVFDPGSVDVPVGGIPDPTLSFAAGLSGHADFGGTVKGTLKITGTSACCISDVFSGPFSVEVPSGDIRFGLFGDISAGNLNSVANEGSGGEVLLSGSAKDAELTGGVLAMVEPTSLLLVLFPLLFLLLIRFRQQCTAWAPRAGRDTA